MAGMGLSSAPGCGVVYVPGGTFICCQKWSIKSIRSNIQEGQVLDQYFPGRGVGLANEQEVADIFVLSPGIPGRKRGHQEYDQNCQ